MDKCLILQRKILQLSNLSLFETETIFSQKNKLRKKKSKLLLWICARQLSGHLWFNGSQKLLVTSLN